MGVSQSVYVGPYATLRWKEIFSHQEVKVCPNGHKRQHENNYCSKCGEKIQRRTRDVEDIGGFQDFLNEQYPEFGEWEDAFFAIPEGARDAYQILIPNSEDFGKDYGNTSFEDHVYPNRVMKELTEFNSAYSDLLFALQEWSGKVDIKFGTVSWWN